MAINQDAESSKNGLQEQLDEDVSVQGGSDSDQIEPADGEKAAVSLHEAQKEASKARGE